MIAVSYSLRQKLFAELKSAFRWSKKYSVKRLADVIKSNRGGGFGTIFIGLACILLIFTVLINTIDYSLYSYKRNAISKAIDYAVTGAVQQIDKNRSSAGISKGFADDTGETLTDGIQVNIDMAEDTFLSMFYENLTLDNININGDLLVCAASADSGGLKYTLKSVDELISEGYLDDPVLVEEKINQAIDEYWPDDGENIKIYIDGNPKTNAIEKGTYFFAFIKSVKISGLYSERNISLSSFSGAKVERY